MRNAQTMVELVPMRDGIECVSGVVAKWGRGKVVWQGDDDDDEDEEKRKTTTMVFETSDR